MKHSNYALMKRAVDFACATAGLAALSPIFVLIAGAIKVSSPGPVLYRGVRVGQHGIPFRIFKFRTMVVDAERLGGASTSSSDARVTPIGRFLRAYKLDELPQLFNVLFGEMSLVGPRPEVQKYVDMYTEHERQILDLRPGITDWASIWNADEGAVLAGAGDPDRAYEQLIRPTKLRLQLKYASECSLFVDLQILSATAARLLCRDWMPAELAPYGRLVPASKEVE